MNTPIFDAVVAELGDPKRPVKLPATPSFSVLGYKARKRLAGETNRVLREAGFAPKRVEIEMRKDA